MKYIISHIILFCLVGLSFSNEDIPLSPYQKAINDSIQKDFFINVNRIIAPIFKIPDTILNGWPFQVTSNPQCKSPQIYYFKITNRTWLCFTYSDSLRGNRIDIYTDKSRFKKLSKLLLKHKFIKSNNWIGDTFEYGSICIMHFQMGIMPPDNCLSNQFKSFPYHWEIIPKLKYQ